MLPSGARMRSSDEFRLTARRGVRAARPSVVVHARLGDSPPAQVGFVVSKAVGNAVTRNRTKRRLRHLAAARLAGLPATARVVVRALPAAAATPERLVDDFTAAWDRALARVR
ncbi:ribonuclease P protein component [Raineyella sp. W15-4]|uniref:ribonuclease P protein component n=1 Tax=Raineyella sp. W15-4 TaxID=3081651 RepID=UPI002953C09D|nr:ribonuclease P protein component [Raineyella sp. W15-4]WOQ17058.1 ribonuclease P protein component [Raineyella sp. W15-4]